MPRKRPVIISATLILALALAGDVHSQSTEARAVELAEVDVTKVAPRDISSEVRISGSLTPIRRSSLTARVAGTIIELPVQVGDIVKKGDLLVRFDAEGLKSALTARAAEVDAINAQLELAENVLQRNTSLQDRGASSEAARLEANAQVLNLRAQLRSKQAVLADAQRSLDDAEVHAEFDGAIAARPVEQGQTVPVNGELMTIVDPSKMEVDAGVPTSRIPRVRIGQPVELSVEGFQERKFTGEVTRIAPTAVAGSRAVRVFVAIRNDDLLLRGGMFTTGVLKVDDQKDVIALPTSAIRTDSGGPFVLKIVDRYLRRQEVTLGMTWSDQDLVEVDGLEAGDVVVSAPLPQLVSDMPVIVEGK